MVMGKKKAVIVLFFLLGLFSASNAQSIPDSILTRLPMPELGPNDTIPVEAKVYQNAEIIPSGTLEWIWVTAKYPKHLLEKRKEWTRLRNAVYVTYPYARKAGLVINEINARLQLLQQQDKRQSYIKSREKELKKEFTDPLTNLSVYQGKILMKLINRQTGNNCYELIKEYKGGFSARFWQTIAFFFNSSLKQPYDAVGEDQVIESIVKEVEEMYGIRSS
jgi:hypothetical protein